jgi:iron complex transport system substrate-binding protein
MRSVAPHLHHQKAIVEIPMFRRLSRSFAALSILLALAACGGPPAAPTAAPAPADAPVPTAAAVATAAHSAAAEAPAGFPVTIQDCGRTLTFTKAPERIVTTYPNAAELLIRLGLGDKIVGSMYHKDTPVTPAAGLPRSGRT